MPAAAPFASLVRGLRWLAFLGAITYLSSELGRELHGSHVWRQAHVASNVALLLESGFSIAPGAYNHGLPELLYDFPIFQWGAAAIALVFGLEAHVAARVLGLLVFAGSFFVLVRLLACLEPRPLVRELTLILFCLAPIELWYSSAPVPDPLAVLLSLVALLALVRGRAPGGRRAQWLAVLCASAFLATAIKSPVFLPVAVVILADGWRARGWRCLVERPWILAGASCFVAVVLYAVVAHVVNTAWQRGHPLVDPAASGGRAAWFFSTLGDRLDADLWGRIARTLAKHVLNPVAVALTLAGLVIALRRRAAHAALLAWLAGSLLTILLFFNLHWRHGYYQLPYVAPLAWIAAVGAASLMGRLPDRAWLRFFAVVGLVLVSALFSMKYLGRLAGDGAGEIAVLQRAGEMSRAETTASDFVIYVVPEFDHQPQPLWFARRHGITLERGRLAPALLGQVRGRYSFAGRLLAWWPATLRDEPPPWLREVASGPAGILLAPVD